MRLVQLAVLLIGVLCNAALAGETPVYAPPPAWVKPMSPPAESDKADDGAVRFLLSDLQIAFEPGRRTLYSHMVLKLQTPQGLAAGNISYNWRPETDEFVVHKLLIRRGDEVIDVLASGQTFTVVRRETNLESAMLDGVLTANIQPEGLQVGDILEIAVSISSSDPTLKDHVEQVAGSWNGIRIDRAHLRMQWPSSMPIRLQQSPHLPPMKPMKRGGLTTVELALENVEPVLAPKNAPPRYHLGRMIEVTDFASWADLAALMAPLYEKTAVIPKEGPLRDELERIRALSTNPRARAEAALKLVQDRVRYVLLAMGEGNLVPADAATTWARRFGDCKGKTALLLALLHELGIEAEPVIVSTTLGDSINERLPMVGLFDHVIVRAVIDGRTYWLDGTRTGDASLDRLVTPAFGWGLPLLPEGAELVYIMPGPLELPLEEMTIHFDARGGLTTPAPARVETTMRGDQATAVNFMLTNMGADERDRALREYWRKEFRFIDIDAVGSAFDAKTGELRLTLEGRARMDWDNDRYETDRTRVGYRADFHREPGPDRDAPFAVGHPFHHKATQTILLPQGFSASDVLTEEDVEETVAGVEYRRHATFADNVFTITRSARSVAPEFPAAEAEAAQKRLRELADQTFYLRKPDVYQPSEQELEAALDTEPKTFAEFVKRGYMFLEQRRFDQAIDDFDRALELEPDNSWTLVARALAYSGINDFEAAHKDLDAALALEPQNAFVHFGRGRVAEEEGEYEKAIAAFTKSLELDPKEGGALARRAMMHQRLENTDAALEDAAAALKLNPQAFEMHLLRADIFHAAGKEAEVLAEMEALLAVNPGISQLYTAAAHYYSKYGRAAEAARAYERALAIQPEPYIYLDRAEHLPGATLDQRLADIDAALKMQPKMRSAFTLKARLLEDAGDFTGAVAVHSALMELLPDELSPLAYRGVAHARAGDMASAEKDFAAARKRAKDAAQLNTLCWAKATGGVALDSALKDCNEALKQEPDAAAIYDSRALVLMRLGRLDEAIADYTGALELAPGMPSSLFGRAVAYARKGDKARADADAAAALKAAPEVGKQYERYGITL